MAQLKICGEVSGKENAYNTLKSEVFAVSLRKNKKQELLSLKRMKNLTAKCASFYGHPNGPAEEGYKSFATMVPPPRNGSAGDRSHAYQFSSYKTQFVRSFYSPFKGAALAAVQ